MVELPTGITIREASWREDRAALMRVREEVFIREQDVPAELEWDAADENCFHVLAESAKRDAIGTGRLEADGKIGRIAILHKHRSTGIGTAILERLIMEARRRNMAHVYLYAQLRALHFYERHGFLADGPAFLEADIPHRRMHRALQTEP
ncbi:MAG: GNAT family N-acetyltransferase [Gammaproteobacteria bacterium]|nr:GNAT family N-acetyltransferase [Gammaproteobacteria bacterium]